MSVCPEDSPYPTQPQLPTANDLSTNLGGKNDADEAHSNRL